MIKLLGLFFGLLVASLLAVLAKNRDIFNDVINAEEVKRVQRLSSFSFVPDHSEDSDPAVIAEADL